ncbi:glycosyltransferase [Parabacteroides sp. Marseille-P3160]|uniref:glycosyltransferase n=1 Tax=Parabacteroides sp. Marseille-P3160 TaxID=1917887 RepID=UPI00190E8A0A|nr:glycosyltransferase [Parabacteroides sp. Marseille-P3160]
MVNIAPKHISIIISTYNHPEWLEKTLWGYECQSYKNFDVLIADDGSGEETATLVKQFQRSSGLTIKHVWHPDNGFQKCEILNRAIMNTEADYLIFTDQDCNPMGTKQEMQNSVGACTEE